MTLNLRFCQYSSYHCLRDGFCRFAGISVFPDECLCIFCRLTLKSSAQARKSTNPTENGGSTWKDAWDLRNPLWEPKSKIKMTASWRDYLLCQLSSGKRLSALETLPPEILEAILNELHNHSISGLRALAHASRTCKALTSPYISRPCQVSIKPSSCPGDLVATAFLTYTDNFKTLRIHNQEAKFNNKCPDIEGMLREENSVEAVDYLPNQKYLSTYDRYYLLLALEIFCDLCPNLTRLSTHGASFEGYSFGWDREWKETLSPKRRVLKQYNAINWIIPAIGKFRKLKQLTIHFNELQYSQIALMHPLQGRLAVLEMYQKFEEVKQGEPLSQMDVTFFASSSHVFGRKIGFTVDARVSVTFRITKSSFQGGNPVVTYSDPWLGNIMDYRESVREIYGPKKWQNHLGPCMYERFKSQETGLQDKLLDLAIMAVLLPSRCKQNRLKAAGLRGLFNAGDLGKAPRPEPLSVYGAHRFL